MTKLSNNPCVACVAGLICVVVGKDGDSYGRGIYRVLQECPVCNRKHISVSSPAWPASKWPEIFVDDCPRHTRYYPRSATVYYCDECFSDYTDRCRKEGQLNI